MGDGNGFLQHYGMFQHMTDVLLRNVWSYRLETDTVRRITNFLHVLLLLTLSLKHPHKW
jgi:hypothetical protein